jgi:hypothetical protein
VVWESAVVENLREKERCKSSRRTPPRPRPLLKAFRPVSFAPNFDRQLLLVRLFAPVTERPRITPTRQRRFCVAGERAERMKSDLRESQHNGTPRDPGNGPGSLGMMTIVVTNLGTDINNPGSIIGLLQWNAGIPTVDYGALKVAAAAGNKLVCNTF